MRRRRRVKPVLSRQNQLLFRRFLARRPRGPFKSQIIEFLTEGQGNFMYALNFLSVICLSILFCSMCMDTFGIATQTYVAYAIVVTMVTNLYFAAALIEKNLPAWILNFRSTRIFWLGGTAAAVFLARGQAFGEVNGIFGLDASAFPFATYSGTAMILIGWLMWPAAILGGAIYIHLIVRNLRRSLRNFPLYLSLAVHLIAFGVILYLQAFHSESRMNNVYQISRQFDFDEKFDCQGAAPGLDGVVFLGAEQKRALAAPPLTIKHANPHALLKIADIPTFKIVDCH